MNETGPKSGYNWLMLQMTFRIFLVGILAGQAWAFGSKSNDSTQIINQSPLTITGTEVNPQAIKPGGVAELKISFQIEKNYHAYIDQFKLDVIQPKDLFLTEFHIVPLTEFRDPVSKKIKVGAKGKGVLTTLIQLPSNFPPGFVKAKVDLTYQACTTDYCLFPTKAPFEFVLSVAAAPADDILSQALAKGWLYALLAVFLAGVLTSLTPCIFPLIPITLAVIGSKDAGGSRFRGAFISLCYVLGIAVTYSILGVIAAKTGAMFGSLLGHPLVVGLISFLFLLMGLSMYGLFELKFPDRWAGALVGRRWEKGAVGAFFSGLIAGVVASPCVGPVLIGILAYVAQTQDTLKGFVLLFTFAFGLGQLFLVLGTFSQLLHRLPKSGPWMEKIKFIFGTTMIGMALYFIYPVTHSTLFDGLIATSLILISSFFGAFDKLNKFGAAGKLRKTIMLLVFFIGWVFAIKTLLPDHIEKQIFPEVLSTQKTSVQGPEWFTYSEGSLQKATEKGRIVILDFKADWCLACKELELYTFSDPRVLEKGKNYLWLEFDATRESPELIELRKKYDIPGLPAVLIFDSSGKWNKELSLFGFEDADHFLERLNQL